MPRQRRQPRTARALDCTLAEMAFFLDQPPPPDCEVDFWCLAGNTTEFRPDRPNTEELWKMLGAGIITQWAETRPGSRPASWWRFAQPSPLRLRLGGRGRPCCEWSANGPRFHLGVPIDWSWVRGDGSDTPDHASITDPPTFESQARCLLRLGALLPTERTRITKRDLLPVTIER
jgi:hypothetical protein